MRTPGLVRAGIRHQLASWPRPRTPRWTPTATRGQRAPRPDLQDL